MDVNQHTKSMNLKFGKISEEFVQTIIDKKNGDKIELITEKMNGISSRISSFSYHIDLIQRELYDEKKKIFQICEGKKIFFGSDEFRQQSHHIMTIIMQRATFLLRDIIADFFGALDNLAQIITIYNKNADGKRISRVMKSLKHDHAKDTELGKYLLNEWETWIKSLYDGYRKDAIHFNPDNCKVSHTIKMWRKDPEIPNEMESSEDININLPKPIAGTFKYDEDIDFLNFCYDLQNRLMGLVDNSLKKLI